MLTPNSNLPFEQPSSPALLLYSNYLLQLAAKKAQLGPERYARSKYDLAGKLIATTIQVGMTTGFLMLFNQ